MITKDNRVCIEKKIQDIIDRRTALTLPKINFDGKNIDFPYGKVFRS